MHEKRMLAIMIAVALISGAGCIGEMGAPIEMEELEEPDLIAPPGGETGEDPDGPASTGWDSEELVDVRHEEELSTGGTEECFDNMDNNGDEFVDCHDPDCDCTPEDCADNIDNDGDGLVDCQDPQCGCAPENCTDNVDNDGDSLPDCFDPDCDCAPEDCRDNIDNDGDEFVDCLDPQCDCAPEDCADNIDNDTDGLVDCFDPACDCTPENCTDNVDNDGDALVDCYDPQCDCVPEICSDGVDNDGDGRVDCHDPQCDCSPENCRDNIDNDLDGAVDCVDTDCDCVPEVCFDGADNDADGLIDCGARPDPECPCHLFVEGCRESERIAFLNCNNDRSATISPGGYDVTTFTCIEVLAAPYLLNGFDTIAFYGGGAATGGWGGWGGGGSAGYDYNAMTNMLDQLYRSGAKVIILANPDMHYLSVGDISTHFHNNDVTRALVTVSSPNTMTDAFVQAEQAGKYMVQLHSDSPDWCGDLFFTLPGYNGHFVSHRRDTTARRGIMVYNGLYSPTSDAVDFAERFVNGNLTQQWNPGWGTSERCGLTCGRPTGHGVGKPVIYLYPEEEQRVTVELDFDGQLITTYPTIDEELGGWDVIAHPDGTLFDTADGHEYNYIYWNGVSSAFTPNWESGFVVRGEDTVEFLQTTLAEMGMLPYEYNEMIVYWLPYMEHHDYNLIHFAAEEYTDIARMTITPEPDSLLRVFMVFQELDEPIEIPEQTFEPFFREGFTVVEWGGSEIDGDWRVVR